MNRDHRNRIYVAASALSVCTIAAPASALTFAYSLRASAAYQLDGPRDLGLNGGEAEDALVFNLSPRLFVEFSPTLIGYLRGRAFLPTREVSPLENDQATQQRPVKRFASLDEFWLQYNGLTNYPGEALRIGRQLIRQPDATWVSQNADSVRFRFDTTLLSTDIGVIHQFSAYRTDGEPVTAVQRDRTYGYAVVSGDWQPGDQIGARVMHALDHKALPSIGTPIGDDVKQQDANFTWVGVFADNSYYKPTLDRSFYYRADLVYLVGEDRQLTRLRGGLAGPVDKTSLGALLTSAEIRWRPLRLPLQFGLGYTWSQGGGSNQYQQSGVQGNASNFTGTSTLTYRYSDTLRAELGNLHIATAFVSFKQPDDEASLIYNNFRKDDRAAPITTNNVIAPTNSSSSNVGNALDLVLSHYFKTAPISLRRSDDELDPGGQRTSLRLRASVFDPGAAYGPGTDLDYRVVIEGTLWVN